MPAHTRTTELLARIDSQSIITNMQPVAGGGGAATADYLQSCILYTSAAAALETTWQSNGWVCRQDYSHITVFDVNSTLDDNDWRRGFMSAGGENKVYIESRNPGPGLSRIFSLNVNGTQADFFAIAYTKAVWFRVYLSWGSSHVYVATVERSSSGARETQSITLAGGGITSDAMHLFTGVTGTGGGARKLRVKDELCKQYALDLTM